MPDESLSAALVGEHREIDGEIEAFIARLDDGSMESGPLMTALQALRRHIYLEEVFLFPPIRGSGLVMPIFVMLRQHGELWQTMDTLTELLAAGAGVAPLREAGSRLLSQLEAHNAKEEPVIYPSADSGLPPQTSTDMARFIEDGHMPDGWMCQHAQLPG